MSANEQQQVDQNENRTWLDGKVSRRSFMTVAGALAAGASLGAGFVFARGGTEAGGQFGDPVPPVTDASVDIKYSVCLACHSACGIRCKIVDGVLVKIDGNPYHPNGMEPHLPYATDPETAKLSVGRVCAKGQSGLQVLYNPYRIKRPLKRVGARGEGKWQPISWEAAFSEIAARLGPYRDLVTNVDPGAPELGPVANKVLFSGGRNEHGQKEFTDRFWAKGFGTINKRHDHTSICETSHHVGYALATESEKGSTDLPNCRFVLWFGSDPLAANFPFVAQARKLITMLENGGKLAVVDPRYNVAASKADWWLPVLPGTDAALAMAIGRYIIDNTLYNLSFLQRPHDGAANPSGELNTTDATHLVKIEGGRPTTLLRADEAGIPGGTADDFVVWSAGAEAQYDTVDVAALLPGPVTVNGILCKTAFEIYAEQTQENSIAQWASICGIEETTITAIANELVSHGRQASVEHYRGPVQNTNGTYTSWAIINLNTLIGNFNWKGGHVFGGSHWHEMGGKTGNRFSPGTVVGGVDAAGIGLTRTKVDYEDSTEFGTNGYPARRPWFPFALHLNYQEIIPSIDDAYPYSIGALILYWNNIAYSTPAAKATALRVLGDESKIPFIVAIDIEMGETTAWADLILPDTTYLERWSTPHVGSAINTKASGIRQPVVGTFDGDMNYTPYLPQTKMMEDILIGIGKAMGLPMNLEDENGDPTPLDRAWDYHRQLIHNIGDEDGGPGLDYVLARGGRFEDYGALYNGDEMSHKMTKHFHFYREDLASTTDSMTGDSFDGVAKYEPIKDLLGNGMGGVDTDFPLTMVTYKHAWHSMARTICNPWLVSILPENLVEINKSDADARGIKSGDMVKVTSVSLPEGSTARALVTETVRPGVVAIAHSFGHWEMSSKAYTEGGRATEFDATRAAGIAANPLMRSDPVKSNVALQDKVGGSVSYSSTKIQVAKV